jgi:hypothetical protein
MDGPRLLAARFPRGLLTAWPSCPPCVGARKGDGVIR